MRANRQVMLAVLLSMLSMGRMHAAALRHSPGPAHGSGPVEIQVFPESTFLDLDPVDGANAARQTTTQVRVAVKGNSADLSHSIGVYACFETGQAMKLSGKSSGFAAADLRIRNDRGEWAELEALPDLQGRLGVRLAIFKGSSASIPLEVRLQVPSGQAPGKYQGVLTIQALEQ